LRLFSFTTSFFAFKLNNYMTKKLVLYDELTVNEMCRKASMCVDKGDFIQAEAIYRDIISRIPNHHRSLHGLGVVMYRGRKDTEEAVRLVQQAIQLKPDYLDAFFNLRKMLNELGRFVEAEECYQKAMALKPDSSVVCLGLGNLCCQKQKFEEAVSFYQKAIEYSPDAKIYVAMGKALRMLFRIEEAVNAFHSALAIQSDCGEALLGLSMSYEISSNYVAAEEYAQKALKLLPTSADCMQVMAVLKRASGKATEAVDWYKSAVKVGGGLPVFSNMLYAMNFSTYFSQDEILYQSRIWERKLTLKTDSNVFPARQPGKLRIGYISPDFRKHVVAFFFEPLLAAHNHNRFEIHCYSNVLTPDNVTEQLKGYADYWHDIRSFSDEEAIARIRDDRIDILIDLSGHTADNRLGIFAHRAAPIQITWLGYPNTTGISAMDYRITDAVADPEGFSDEQHSERLMRLPDCFLCYQPPKNPPDVASTPLLINGFVTFGCFNYPAKITPEVIAIWSNILLSVPFSRLLLKSQSFCDPVLAKNFTACFEAHGIATERIMCVPAKESFSDHLATYNHIDIALDPFPYNGTTTTFEALFMGVPVITLRGNRHAARVGSSILTNLGATELIAETVDDYLALSVSLSSDVKRLSTYHLELRNLLVSSALCDSARFADSIEEVFRTAWQAYSHAHPVSPPHLDGQFLKAQKYFTRGEYEQSRSIYEDILSDQSDNPRALHGMGVVCHWLADSESAIRYISRAIELTTNYPVALTNLGGVYKETGRVREAIDCFRKALASDPCFSEIHSNILMNMQYLSEYCYDDVLKESLRWSDLHARLPCQQLSNKKINSIKSGKIRIGFVSADFRKHPVGFFVIPFFSNYDHEQFELFCYSNSNCSDEITKQIISLVDIWRVIEGMPDRIAWQMIHDDAIDVLVDLSGHTAGNRLILFSMRPAPVQMTWLGYPNTTGISAMDFRITDADADPVGASEANYSEQLIRLSNCFLCYQPPIDPPDFSPPPIIRNGFITFGCFNQLPKITSEIINCWIAILMAVPNSRFLLKSQSFRDPDFAANFSACFGSNGVTSDRIICIPTKVSFNDHLATYNEIDIALDTFPYNGTTTTFEALFMGVPVISLRGNCHAGRVGASILNNLGLAELIAETLEDYLSITIVLSRDIQRLSTYHAGLRELLVSSVLCDAARFVDSFEDMFRTVWQKYNHSNQATFSQTNLRKPTIVALYENEFELENRCNEAAQLVVLGKLKEAEACYEALLADFNGYPRALHALGVVRYRIGNIENGLELVRNALVLKPDYIEALQSLGKMLNEQKCYLEASNCYRRILCLKPDDQNSLLLMAIILSKAGEREKAINAYQRLVAAAPEHFDAIFNLGQLQIDAKQFDQAEKLLHRARQLSPDNAGVLLVLGNLALSKRDFKTAEIFYLNACKIEPDCVELQTNLGYLYTELKHIKKAITHSDRAVKLKPDFALGYVNLGCALEKSGQIYEAVEAYKTAIKFDPALHKAHSSLIMLMHYLPETTPEDIFQMSLNWNSLNAECFSNLWSRGNCQYSQDKIIRIGFISPDFRRHPVAYFIQSFFEFHNRDEFEIICYSDAVYEDDFTQILRNASDSWKTVIDTDDYVLNEVIREDHIDILVDLAGHTVGNRLRVFAMKPAPIQVTWAGYAGTTGLSAIDYLISDRFQSPPDAEEYSSEQIIRMPDDYISYCPPQYAHEVSSLPALSNGYLTFGVFNNLAKVSTEVLCVWVEILNKVEGSRLFIKNPSFDDPFTVKRYLEFFKSRGISAELIITEGLSSPAEMLDRYSHVDIQLDTFPYCGGLTTLESLWMGVPVITLSGNLFSSRHSLSHLMNVGLDEYVASSREEYVAIACQLAGDLERLSVLRTTLRQKMADSPLCDGITFTKNIQEVFRKIWEKNGSVVKSEALDIGAIEQPVKIIEKQLSGDHITFNDQGNIHSDNGDFDSAIKCYIKALDLKPGYVEAYFNMGLVYNKTGNLEEAIRLFDHAIATSPDFAAPFISLSNLYLSVGKLGEAIAICNKALENIFDCPEIYNNLGSAYMKLGNFNDSLAAFRKALELDPNYHQVRSNILFLLHSIYQTTIHEVFEESRNWDIRHGRLEKYSHIPEKLVGSSLLRIGFISPDFRSHPVGFFIQSFMMLHDRNSFEIFCYSDVISEDHITKRICESVDVFRDIHEIDDEEVSEIVFRDNINILVDLAGHTNGNRLRVFAMKPAPVQVTWAGYVGTTGLSTMNYLISDRFQSPEGSDAFSTETIIRMPDDYICYMPPEDSPAVSPLPVDQNGYVTFGSFNKPSKISDESIALWSEVLKLVDGSRLFLKNASFSDSDAIKRYTQMFSRFGITNDRLIFEGPASHYEMLASYGKVDIQLDTFPYSGGLTTLESLWMGVPVVTLPGKLFSSRHSLSHLMNAGLGELVASTQEEYVAIVCKLAVDLNRLSTLRTGLRHRLISSPICDGSKFTNNLQRVFRWMWHSWSESDFNVPLVFCGENEIVKLQEDEDFKSALFTDDFSKGLLCIQLNDFLGAAEMFEAVLVNDPDNADAHNNLGIAYFEIGFRDDAKDEFRTATKIAPNHAEAWKNLGKANRDTGGNSELSARCFRKALSINPYFDEAWMMLGASLLDSGRSAEAVNCFKKTLELNPKNCDAHSNLLFAMNYIAQISQEDLFLESLKWNEIHTFGIERIQPSSKIFPHLNPNTDWEGNKLRIGYVSGDFKHHPVGYHLLPILASYDRNKFELYCYATICEQDDMTEKMQGYVSCWRDISKLTDIEAAARIIEDRIDILVDLAGHTKGHRLRLFAMKPAPIQVSWLGYFNTTGVNAIDYLISDETTISVNEEHWFSEKIIRLPESRFCYSPPEYAPPVVKPPVLKNGYITFGSFNNIAKLTPAVIELWSKVLISIPDSKLIIKWSNLGRKKERDRLLKSFRCHDICDNRLILRGKSSHADMLKEYGDIDIALDPFPFSGGMTSCEALWMGVPILTLMGNKPAGRQTASFLRTIDLPEWIIFSQEQFIAKAKETAFKLEELKKIRFELRARMMASTLCDGAKFTRNLEELYFQIEKESTDLKETTSKSYNDAAENIIVDANMRAAMLYNDGIDQMEAGNFDKATRLFEQSVSLNPGFAMAYNNLGIIKMQTCEIDEAKNAFELAISADSSFAEAYYNLGLTFEKKKYFHEAIECFESSIRLNSEYGEAYLEKGNALLALKEPYHALECYEQASEHIQESAIISNNIGSAYHQLEDINNAELYFREALFYDHEYAPAYINLSMLFCEMGLVTDAERVASEGLGYFPDNTDLLSVHARTMTAQSRIHEALEDLHRALEVNPQNAALHSSLIYSLQYLDGSFISAISAEQKKWAELHVPADNHKLTFQNDPLPDRKLIIGYVSPDFCRHPVGYFILPILQMHNRDDFVVICYSDRTKSDIQTLMLESYADVWHNTSECTDQELFELISNDKVDVLVDLAGHTAGNRLTLFARKAAPIQISWLGYPNTTGIPTMDYRITDAIADPEVASEKCQSERLIRLPYGFHCYQPTENSKGLGPPPSHINEYITFGCFNNISKITLEVIDLWSRILLAVPDSRLLLKYKSFIDSDFAKNYKMHFVKRGVEEERVKCVPAIDSFTDHLELYRQIDIALDPFPYNGTTTTFETLYMGVPVIALRGNCHAGRVGASILCHLGLEELLAETVDEYLDVTVTLCNDMKRLSDYHLNLRKQLSASPFVDAERFTITLENAYRKAWHIYSAKCAGIDIIQKL